MSHCFDDEVDPLDARLDDDQRGRDWCSVTDTVSNEAALQWQCSDPFSRRSSCVHVSRASRRRNCLSFHVIACRVRLAQCFVIIARGPSRHDHVGIPTRYATDPTCAYCTVTRSTRRGTEREATRATRRRTGHRSVPHG